MGRVLLILLTSGALAAGAYFAVHPLPPNWIPWKLPVLDAAPSPFAHLQINRLRLDRAACTAVLDGADSKALRETMDKLKDRLKSCAVVLAASEGGKVTLIAGVSADLMGKVKAGDLVNFVAQQVGGKGGGRPDMAQAGGNDPAKLPAALASVPAWVAERL